MSEPERKRRGPITLFLENRRFRWATVILFTVLIAYPVSFGPACWVITRLDAGHRLVANAYYPVFMAVSDGPVPVSRALYWYANVGIPDDSVIVLPVDDGQMGLLVPK